MFFATDVHGSEKCFLKFVNAPQAYKVNILILGGDITGKMIVPIVKQSDGSCTAEFLGAKQTLKSDQEIEELKMRRAKLKDYIYHMIRNAPAACPTCQGTGIAREQA